VLRGRRTFSDVVTGLINGCGNQRSGFHCRGLNHRLILTRGLGGSLLRIASFSEWNYFFLVSNLRHASFLGCSGFIYQTADGGSGDPVLLRHFRQAQTGEAGTERVRVEFEHQK
jgi:hypothetical protein